MESDLRGMQILVEDAYQRRSLGLEVRPLLEESQDDRGPSAHGHRFQPRTDRVPVDARLSRTGAHGDRHPGTDRARAP